MCKSVFFPLVGVLLSMQVQALETDWLNVKKGSEDKSSGAIVRDVIASDKEGKTEVTVTIPKKAVSGTKQPREVVVYGQQIDKNELEIHVSYEWLTDYDNDNYGLLIKFGSRPEVPFRLYFKGDEGNKINP